MRRISRFSILVLLLALGACAGGPTLKESQSNISQVPADRGRIYFYRTNSMFGAAIQPSVRLDGVVAGDSVPGGVFFCDVSPGQHIATVKTEVENRVTIDVVAGKSSYVKMDKSFGVMVARIDIEVVPPEIGADDTLNSHLVKSQCNW